MCPDGHRDYVPMILCVELIQTNTLSYHSLVRIDNYAIDREPYKAFK